MFTVTAVTLHVRVWIEISNGSSTMAKVEVTLHVRVWIEIIIYICI